MAGAPALRAGGQVGPGADVYGVERAPLPPDTMCRTIPYTGTTYCDTIFRWQREIVSGTEYAIPRGAWRLRVVAIRRPTDLYLYSPTESDYSEYVEIK